MGNQKNFDLNYLQNQTWKSLEIFTVVLINQDLRYKTHRLFTWELPDCVPSVKMSHQFIMQVRGIKFSRAMRGGRGGEVFEQQNCFNEVISRTVPSEFLYVCKFSNSPPLLEIFCQGQGHESILATS